jgi:uncharacterized membrane protein YcaP (DUF421 family)
LTTLQLEQIPPQGETVETVLNAVAVYLFLLIVFRLSGKRTMAQATPFDLTLLLIISEAVQNALTGDDRSLTKAFVVVLTLVVVDIGLSLLKVRSPGFDRLLDDVPVVIFSAGEPLKDRMRLARVDESDLLEAARELYGLERLDQVKYAVLERSGKISIVPKDKGNSS